MSLVPVGVIQYRLVELVSCGITSSKTVAAITAIGINHHLPPNNEGNWYLVFWWSARDFPAAG